jgi:transcriptional regulator with XRE-family HTH domain
MGKEVSVKEIRMRSGLTQGRFWGLLGVTQSGGSRIESGIKMSEPLQILFDLATDRATKSAARLAELRNALGVTK